ncbi:MAG: hypothetical protein N3G21_06325 [Candidatus Hydrogenedentes bacterium]|nr:hypothetical protein [Candidatus Hydrogenedentota bacterium]
MRILKIKDSIGAGVSIHFLNAQNERIETIEERLTEPTEFFVPITLYSQITPNTSTLRIAIFLHQSVEVEVYEPQVSIFQTEDKNREVLIEELPNRKYKLIGFGVEDDGRFYDSQNRQLGVDKKGELLRVNRLNHLTPHWVRTFVWFKEWSPNEDGETFTWNSDGILSLCKTLEYYQSNKIPVNLTCVTWGMENPWDNPEVRIKEIIALLKYLKKEKRFTCIKYFTLTNEPNYFFNSNNRFEKFVDYHCKLSMEFKKNKLDIELIGSDDAMGTDWFCKCLSRKSYRSCVELWASHFYWNYTVVPYANHLFEERINLLRKHYRNSQPSFIVTEFGITDSRFRPPFNNPLMQEFDGALYTVSTIIDGLNAGVTGFNIWCLQEVAYPGGKDAIMRIGLWGYADKNWQIFPVYHALAMFTRNTKPGDMINPLHSSSPELFKSVKIGANTFFANIGTKELILILSKSREYKLVWVYESYPNNLYKLKKKKVEISNEKSILVPPRSFGYLSE